LRRAGSGTPKRNELERLKQEKKKEPKKNSKHRKENLLSGIFLGLLIFCLGVDINRTKQEIHQEYLKSTKMPTVTQRYGGFSLKNSQASLGEPLEMGHHDVSKSSERISSRLDGCNSRSDRVRSGGGGIGGKGARKGVMEGRGGGGHRGAWGKLMTWGAERIWDVEGTLRDSYHRWGERVSVHSCPCALLGTTRVGTQEGMGPLIRRKRGTSQKNDW